MDKKYIALAVGGVIFLVILIIASVLLSMYSSSSSTATTKPAATQAATQAATDAPTDTPTVAPAITTAPAATLAPVTTATQYVNADYPNSDITSIDLTKQQNVTLQSIQTQYPNSVGVVVSVGTGGTPTMWVKSAFGTPVSTNGRATISWTPLPSAPAFATVKALTTNDMTLSYSQQASTCNKSACEAVIDSYLSKGWTYVSSNFGECAGCPVVQYPNKQV